MLPQIALLPVAFLPARSSPAAFASVGAELPQTPNTDTGGITAGNTLNLSVQSQCRQSISGLCRAAEPPLFLNRFLPSLCLQLHPQKDCGGSGERPRLFRKERAEPLFRSSGREKKDGRRIIFENEYFTVYVPFFSPITYGVHVTANRQVPHIGAMADAELNSLGETLRDCCGMYDALFDKPFPYMMCMHNAPVNSGGFDASWQFHVEYFPPMRGENVQQFFASSETGVGAWCNPNCPEEKAGELAAAYRRYSAGKSV